LQIIQDLPRIFSDGILLQSDQKQEGSADRATYHHYGTKVQLDGREIFVRIVVREENGNLFYDSHVTEGKEIRKFLDGFHPDSLKSETNHQGISKDRLALFIYDVKRGINGSNPLKQGENHPNAMVSFSAQDGRALITMFAEGNITSLVHELGHVFRRDLNPADLNVVVEQRTRRGRKSAEVVRRAGAGAESR
jgi:hypothetical protein